MEIHLCISVSCFTFLLSNHYMTNYPKFYVFLYGYMYFFSLSFSEWITWNEPIPTCTVWNPRCICWKHLIDGELTLFPVKVSQTRSLPSCDALTIDLWNRAGWHYACIWRKPLTLYFYLLLYKKKNKQTKTCFKIF